MTQLRCLDAAAVGARLAARGEPAGQVDSAIAATAPSGAQVQVRRDGDLVRVQVAVQLHALGLNALLPAIAVTASAVSLAEPGPAVP
jgi:hypothetical protein